MAGFFLYKTNDKKLNVHQAKQVFADNGLINPCSIEMGDYTLLLFKKLAEEVPAMATNDKGICAAVGAYVYKGLNSEESLKTTLDDFINHQLSLADMRGQYTLILYSNDHIHLVSDALSAKHFFSDKYFSFYSSSLFSAAAAIGEYTINDMAVYEKLLTGIIVSPDTIINEIVQMNKNQQMIANQSGQKVSFLIHPDMTVKPFHTTGRQESERKQAECILSYFKEVEETIREGQTDLGLSAGHDSTLLFAALVNGFRDQLHLHTHSTGHVHDREKKAATDMAKAKNMDITVVQTPRLNEEDIDLSGLLHENLMFFDGRTSHDIGGFSATYRSQYRYHATNGSKTTFSGVGGECLRNHYSVRGKKINADEFFTDKIFNKSFAENTSQELIEKVKNAHIKKAEAILKVPLHGKVDRINLRRYYSEVLMADGQGNVIDAYNTVSKCFAPFLEQSILTEAYRGMFYLGNYGEYESGIINMLDPDIGSCTNANNGYPFNHIPMKVRIKENVRTRVSTGTWEKLNRYISGKNTGLSDDNYFKSVMKKNEELAQAYAGIKERYPNVDFDQVINGYAMDANVAYLSMTLRKLNHES